MLKFSQPALQRAASLIQLPPLLGELGIKLEAVLEGTGVSSGDLRPDAFIPFASCQTILDRAAMLTGCEDIGLRLGRRQSLETLGPVGAIMRYSATLGEALSDFVSFQLGNSTGAAVYLLRGPNDVAFGYGVYDSGGHVSPHLHDLVLAVGCTIVAELTEGAVQPLEMLSVRPKPNSVEPYWALARCSVRFGESQTCLYLPAASMGHELRTADSAKRGVLLDQFASRLALNPEQIIGRVKHALRSLLPEGRITMPEVSEHLGLHPRSLRRALAREGATFNSIKDHVRYAVARELLCLTSLPLGDIGMTFGFSTPSSFVHAFRRWSATTPAMWRKKLHIA